MASRARLLWHGRVPVRLRIWGAVLAHALVPTASAVRQAEMLIHQQEQGYRWLRLHTACKIKVILLINIGAAVPKNSHTVRARAAGRVSLKRRQALPPRGTCPALSGVVVLLYTKIFLYSGHKEN